MYRAVSCALALMCAAAVPTVGAVRVEMSSKGYAAMSEIEKSAYVEAQARQISARLSGGAPVTITPDAVRLIRRELDAYASRGGGPPRPGREPLDAVFARGRAVVPTIRRAFEAEGLPAFTGIYIAMIESEFHECLESPLGARGMFQFLPKTAERYGVAAADLCDLDRSAPAAARYVKDRRGELGFDPLGSILAVLAYNAGEKNVATALIHVHGTGASREASFWSLLAAPHGRGLPDYFVNESSRYVPLFFAAAIAGENPHDFGLDAQPLSSF